MPWEVRSTINVAIFLFLIPLFLASRVQAMDCSATNISVAKPVVRFMLMLSELYISWESEPGLKNYTLYYCCDPPIPGMVSKCTSECPDFRQIGKCSTKKKQHSHLVLHLCALLVNQQINYTVYWSTTLHGCNFTSEVAKITPVVGNGEWPKVDELTMKIQSEGLQMGWLHSEDDAHEGLCFRYTFHEIEGAKETMIKRETKKFQVLIPFPDGSHPLKTYEFCIRVHLCLRTDAPYSEIVCNRSQIPAKAPPKPPKWLCGGENKQCPTTVENNLRNVTLLWEVPDNWNGIPKEIKVEVHDMENKITEHVLNSSATNYTLTGLRMDSEYHVVLRMCSNGGCSEISTPVVLPAMQEIKRSDSVLVSPTFWAVLVPCIILITLIAITCFVLERRNTGMNETVPLPHLQEPNFGGACSGNSVATSLYCNPNDYDRLQNGLSKSDTSSLGITENGYDSCSIDSFESTSGRPLLSKASKIADSPENPRIMVTYLAHQRGTVSSLKPSASCDEKPEFV